MSILSFFRRLFTRGRAATGATRGAAWTAGELKDLPAVDSPGLGKGQAFYATDVEQSYVFDIVDGVKIWVPVDDEALLRAAANDNASIEYPHLARLVMQSTQSTTAQAGRPHVCWLCAEPLEHDDQVVWSERAPIGGRPAQRSALAHSRCAILICREDGRITRLDGTVPDVASVKPTMLLLTSSEWDAWQEDEAKPGRLDGSYLIGRTRWIK